MATMKPLMWTLDEGLEIVRDLQDMTREYDYHLTIGGGVVNKGSSLKDLDLYFLPLCNGNTPDPKGLLRELERQWGASEPIGGEREYKDDPRWYKVKFGVGFGLRKTKRIDVFIWK